MKNKLVVLVGVLALLTLPALAQANPATGAIAGTFYVDYFSNNPTVQLPGTSNQWIHLVNLGRTGVPFGGPAGHVCASFYVFDQTQELLACCSCEFTPNEVISTGVRELTANTLTGGIPKLGAVKIILRNVGVTPVAGIPTVGACKGSEAVPLVGQTLSSTDLAAAWGQHIVAEPSGSAVTETEKIPRILSDYEAYFLGQTCAFAQYLGTGKGLCTCGTGTDQPPAPVANAGPNQTVSVGAFVTLNGSGSTSSSGNALTYSWTLISRPAGSTATLSGASTVSPTFVADISGTYMAQLIVNNGLASSTPSTVTISTGGGGGGGGGGGVPPVALCPFIGNFSVLAGSTVTNTGSTTVSGDVGVSPGTAVTGFPPGLAGGTIHKADGAAGQAQTALTAAYIDAAGRLGGTSVAGDLVGQTFTAGVYKSTSSLAVSGDVTLDAQGNPAAVFIFQIASTLTTGSGSHIVLVNGANACNVFWQVGSSATLGTNSVFKGNILALTSITITTGVNLEGRALARNGAVTLDTDVITGCACGL
jgi:hypothetical protein